MPSTDTIVPSYNVFIIAVKMYYMLCVKRERLTKQDLIMTFKKSERTINYYIQALNIALLELYQSEQVIYVNSYLICTDNF